MDGYRRFVNEKLEEGAAWIRIVAEIDPESRAWGGSTSWNRYESFVNVAFASAPTTFLCTYDDRSWPEGVIDHARKTHPVFASGSDMTPNPEYRGSEDSSSTRPGAPAHRADH